jgi:hypothetical protein
METPNGTSKGASVDCPIFRVRIQVTRIGGWFVMFCNGSFDEGPKVLWY